MPGVGGLDAYSYRGTVNIPLLICTPTYNGFPIPLTHYKAVLGLLLGLFRCIDVIRVKRIGYPPVPFEVYPEAGGTAMTQEHPPR